MDMANGEHQKFTDHWILLRRLCNLAGNFSLVRYEEEEKTEESCSTSSVEQARSLEPKRKYFPLNVILNCFHYTLTILVVYQIDKCVSLNDQIQANFRQSTVVWGLLFFFLKINAIDSFLYFTKKKTRMEIMTTKHWKSFYSLHLQLHWSRNW